MKAHIFLIANPKFQLQILCNFGDIIKIINMHVKMSMSTFKENSTLTRSNFRPGLTLFCIQTLQTKRLGVVHSINDSKIKFQYFIDLLLLIVFFPLGLTGARAYFQESFSFILGGSLSRVLCRRDSTLIKDLW